MGETAETPVSMDSIEVQNVVGTGDLGRELDLVAVAANLPKSRYDEQMPGLLYRPPAADVSVLMFASGKVIVMGNPSEEHLRQNFAKCVEALSDIGVPGLEPSAVEVVNIVAGIDVGKQLNLNAVAVGLGLENCEYDPEQFPGLVYRSDTFEAVVMVFGSGTVEVTGATDLATVETAVETITTRLADLGLLDR
jgi:transcription initiation factor TFIID TATA-box-binding protein